MILIWWNHSKDNLEWITELGILSAQENPAFTVESDQEMLFNDGDVDVTGSDQREIRLADPQER